MQVKIIIVILTITYMDLISVAQCSYTLCTYLLGLLAMIKCSICSYQYDN